MDVFTKLTCILYEVTYLTLEDSVKLPVLLDYPDKLFLSSGNLGTHRLYRCLISGRQRYSLWGQTPLFLGYHWRRRISVSGFLLRVLLAVYSLTVYSPMREWSWS